MAATLGREPECRAEAARRECVSPNGQTDGVFTMPWSATVANRRGIEEWRDVVCAENTRELTVGGTAATVPRADKPDF